MNRNLAIRRLCWKELRQLLPLVGLLLLVGTGLQILAWLAPFGGRMPWRDAAALLGMPGLFAAGVGALLVGQEKESRTLDWLRSLPLPASDVVGIKLIIGLLGLLLVWLFSVGLGWATGGLTSIRDGEGSEWLWPLHSLFLLLVGYATAWKFRSSMMALMLVVPLACLPLLVASLHQTIVDWPAGQWYLVNREPSLEIMAAYLLVFGSGFAWYGWRAGLRYLAPEMVAGTVKAAHSLAATRPSALNWSRVAPAPALLWQFAMQNRGILLGLVALQAVATVLSLSSVELISPAIPLIALLFTVSWLGAIVFQSDVPQRRAMFLADRGLSTGLVWLTRQILPVSILVSAFWVVVVVAEGFYQDPQFLQILDPTVWMMLAIVLLSIYLTAQWLGQVANSPIVAAITAPLLAAMIAGYFGYCLVELEASWWSVGVALLLPVLATWLGTRDWMDRRTDRRMWIRHIALAIVFVALPVSGFLVYLVTFPRMSGQARSTLQTVAFENSHLYGGPLELNISTPRQSASDPSEVDPSTLVRSKMEVIRDSLLDSQQRGSQALSTSYVHHICIAAAIRLRLAEGLEEERPAETGAEIETEPLDTFTGYREWITLLLDIHDRLRLSWRLLEQDQADAIEMWVVEELKAKSAQQRLGDSLLQRLQAMLGNSAERQAARLRAVALSWWHHRDQELGGYSLHIQSVGHVTTKQVWTAGRKADVISDLLLQTLQVPEGQQPETQQPEGKQPSATQQQIAALLGRPVLADTEVYMPNSAGQRQLLYSETTSNGIPGYFWNGAWEREGAELSQSLLK
jgi:hypothetical protein